MQWMNLKSGVIAIAVLVLAVSAQIAQAQTIYLKCGDASLTVDVSKNTVDNLPATINETAIDWVMNSTYPDGTTRRTQNHIDRVAGTLIYTYTTCFVSGGFKGTCKSNTSALVTCAAGSAPQKKF